MESPKNAIFWPLVIGKASCALLWAGREVPTIPARIHAAKRDEEER
ncbi:MAG: hypothetical protein ACJAYX_003181 [Planctomycetota bacterium]|jgi:hypothetical protein